MSSIPAVPHSVFPADAVELAVIDTGVAGWEVLRDALPPAIGRILVAPEADGVAVLATALAGRRDIAAIHVLSHGFAGGFHLGAARVDRASLAGDPAAWAGIGAGLVADGAVLLYGCGVASGGGDAFLDDLAEATGPISRPPGP